MELKTNKTFTKWLRKKIKNHKNKDWIEKKIYGKLKLNDKIKNKQNFYKRVKNKKYK
jgi:acetyltransferase-like isoleucine patch superfamily enzyme